MGGGAGIRITVEIDQFYVSRSRNNKRKFVVLEQPVITKWSALGYQDGMRDIAGDLLKAAVNLPEIPEHYVDWMNDYSGIKPGDRLAAWVDEYQWPETTIWRGWVRGKWQNAFPLNIPFDLTIEAYGTTKATLMVEPADRERFGYFWQDVFDYLPEMDPVIAVPVELAVDMHWRDVQVNYGVSNV
jgi:hypothetical protein